MRDFISIGSVPFDEDCAQVGSENYRERARAECARFRDLLQKLYPAAQFRVKSFPHDFGTYYEVVAYYDDNDEEQVKAAFDAEGCEFGTWEALEEEVDRRCVM